MKQLKYYTIIGIVFVLAAGTLFHFVYEWTKNNPVIGLFVPVNESVWEHIKLLFFPMLMYSLVMIARLKKDYPCITSSLFSGIITGSLLIPVLFYSYTCILGKNIFILDISTFILSTLIAFWLAYRLTLSCRLKPYTLLTSGLVVVFFACFLLFTYRPPQIKLFEAPTPHQYGTFS